MPDPKNEDGFVDEHLVVPVDSPELAHEVAEQSRYERLTEEHARGVDPTAQPAPGPSQADGPQQLDQFAQVGKMFFEMFAQLQAMQSQVPRTPPPVPEPPPFAAGAGQATSPDAPLPVPAPAAPSPGQEVPDALKIQDGRLPPLPIPDLMRLIPRDHLEPTEFGKQQPYPTLDDIAPATIDVTTSSVEEFHRMHSETLKSMGDLLETMTQGYQDLRQRVEYLHGHWARYQ